ncbi:MAG: hypothetical protein J0I32_09110 [Sphingobacteriales bacterium]|nr:hypothetical protein [Sphingobacteriales bacterium]OJW00156.1 MAG: hypothetical protein BGO52_03455 [Sphingobacteriales bacterium 44-61]
MKIIKWISHPVIVCFTFLMILVSGDHFGGVYLLYLLMALPHGGLHSILAFIGIGILAVNYVRYRRESRYLFDPLLNVLGVFTLYASLWIFFFRSWEENNNTFEQSVPLITFILYVLCSLSSLIYSLYRLREAIPQKRKY